MFDLETDVLKQLVQGDGWYTIGIEARLRKERVLPNFVRKPQVVQGAHEMILEVNIVRREPICLKNSFEFFQYISKLMLSNMF